VGIKKVPTCMNHAFLEIIRGGPFGSQEAESHGTTKTELWLQQLKTKYLRDVT
jgi:hypothetical protein